MGLSAAKLLKVKHTRIGTVLQRTLAGTPRDVGTEMRRPLPAWALLGASLLVALVAAVGIASLQRYAEINSREATLLTHIGDVTLLLQHLEAEAEQSPGAASTKIQGEWAEERAANLRAARVEMEQALAELARIDADDAHAVQSAVARYLSDIDELARLVAIGAEAEAAAWDDSRVDPSFTALISLVDEEVTKHAAIAAQITRWTGVFEAAVLGLAGLVIGLLFHRFARAGRAVAELAGEQRALRVSEARFHSLIQNALDMITILDADGLIRYVSPAIERNLGYRPDDMMWRKVDLVHPDDQPSLGAAFLAARQDPALTPTVESRFRHHDGSWRWHQATVTNLLADPAVSGLVVNSRDITERKEAENALRQREASLADAQRLARIGSWEWHQGSNHTTWLDELYRLIGTTPEECPASSERYLRFVHPEDRAGIEAIFQQILVTGQRYEHEHRMVGTDGVTKMISATGSVFLDSEGRVAGVRGTVQDISKRKQLEEELRFQAFHDSLTNLPNRSGFLRRLEDALVTAHQTGSTVTVLFLDLDRFKVINDSLGHMSGNQVLVALSKRLTSILSDADMVARFGGDEFAALLTGDLLPDEAERVAYRILDGLHAPFQDNERELFVSTSIGIASSSSAVSEANHLLRAADVAMYHAKSRGPGSYAVFDLDMNAWAVERLELESDLQRAVERNELVLHYQPKVDLVTGAVVAVEALLRWDHPRRGMLYPGNFLQLAEESGLIVPIGRWVLEEACRQAVAWRATMAGDTDCLMGVNLSAREFRQPDLVARVAQVLEESGLPPGALELEITEQVAVDDDQALGILLQLKAIGLHLALDDFGTGHSALDSLRRLPIETLKLDRSFVQDVLHDLRTRAVVQAVTTLAHELGMRVVAEGVETVAQLDAVRALGLDVVQGNYFAPALSATDCVAFLRGPEGCPPRSRMALEFPDAPVAHD